MIYKSIFICSVNLYTQKRCFMKDEMMNWLTLECSMIVQAENPTTTEHVTQLATHLLWEQNHSDTNAWVGKESIYLGITKLYSLLLHIPR